MLVFVRANRVYWHVTTVDKVYKQTSVCVPVAMHAIEYDMVFS
ncbi:hypothetical protein PC110_g12584 [Phytophthora cactorum]|uniref:Uncharacterized protein n=2 Tax=Phytophthora cactorum TaxID=29920 RepID=A0A329S5A1_9STRA|nr:hypothetical protein PC120_g2123 [Phytophthora cactorum]KAG3101753.1 hypothetical protein PC121_g1381 [Phytophthora cactorum]RAW31076.1 hypothetical protein PC110_g12584 [Phytophthora cactorum]